MIGLDTNILVRYIVHDDQQQADDARKLIETQCTLDSPGYICLIVLCELVWVLSRGYGYERSVITNVLNRILSVQELHVQNAELAWRALKHFEKGKADFADYLRGVINRENKAIVTATFGQKAAGSTLFQLVPPIP